MDDASSALELLVREPTYSNVEALGPSRYRLRVGGLPVDVALDRGSFKVDAFALDTLFDESRRTAFEAKLLEVSNAFDRGLGGTWAYRCHDVAGNVFASGCWDEESEVASIDDMRRFLANCVEGALRCADELAAYSARTQAPDEAERASTQRANAARTKEALDRATAHTGAREAITGGFAFVMQGRKVEARYLEDHLEVEAVVGACESDLKEASLDRMARANADLNREVPGDAELRFALPFDELVIEASVGSASLTRESIETHLERCCRAADSKAARSLIQSLRGRATDRSR